MASGLQDIPLRRIPEVWDRQWFADFVRDVLRLADSRNIVVGPEFTLTGQSGEVASLSMGLGTIDLDKLADQAGLSVIGNPATATGPLQALVASLDLQVLRRSGTAVGFGVLDSTFISDFGEAAQDAVGTILTDSASVNFTYDDAGASITAAVLPAGVDHNALANLTTGDPHTQYAGNAQAEVISAAWNFTTRQQVFGTTTANLALVSGLPDTGVSIQCVEQIRTHRVAAEPFFELIRVNSSYAAPSALVSGNSAGAVSWGGYDGTTIQGQTALIFLDITETWSALARGGNLRFQTTTTGTTTKTDRLLLGANSTGDFARFPSGVVTQPGMTFLVDPDNGLYYIGPNNWAAAAGGSKILDIATTGMGITGALSVSGTVTVPNTSFTYAKIQDVSATSRVLGRITSGSGVIEELTAANLATIVNASLDHGTLTGLADDDHTQYVLRSILTTNGDLFIRAAGVVDRLGIGTSLQLLRTVAGAPSWQTLSPVLTLGTDLSGNTTFTDLASATLNATILNDAVTDAKLRNSAALSVIGRSANSTGDPADMAGTADQALRVNTAGTVLGFGTIATGGIAANAATNAKLAQMAQSTIKGRAAAAGTGDPSDLTAAEVVTIINASIDHASLLNLTTGDPHTQYAANAQAEAIAAAWNFTTRQQVFGTTTANIALVTGLADTGISIHSVEQIRTHRVAGEPFIFLTRLNTSYAAPSTLVSGNSAGSIAWGGYDGTTIQGTTALIFLDITETWSGSARGGNLRFQTTTTGATTKSDRLSLGADSTGAWARVPSGLASQPGLAGLSDTNTGLAWLGSDVLIAATNGTERLRVDTATITSALPVSITGNVTLSTAGNKLLIKEGSNASMGVATLVLGTVVVTNTLVTATSRIQLTAQSLGTVTVPSALAVSARTAATSFTILASALTDTSVVAWEIKEPA